MRVLGQLCLLGAFVGTGYSAFACIAGWRTGRRTLGRSGIVAALPSVVALTAAMAVLASALVTKDFRFAYVAQYSSRLLPWYYSLSALWVGQAGSLLLWAWFSGVLALVFYLAPERDRSQLRQPALGILMGYCCFLTATMVFAADPMAPSIAPPAEGAGLSPLLQHPAMLIHPPVVFFGYAAWAIPFALAAAALASGRLDESWTREARPWALVAWAVLGGGILLGADWAYEELGWGGYWGWDPVENGSLIPWLIGTALLHTFLTWQTRGVLKRTALVLAFATFGMCNFATFLTRSGIFSSLHAFSQSPIGWLFLVLMLALAVGGGAGVFVRRRMLAPDKPIQSLWARESMVVLSAVALMVLATVTCAGTLSVALSEAIVGRKIVVGVDFYNKILIPVGLVLLATLSVAPLLRWGASPTPAQRKMLTVSAAMGVVAAATIYVCSVHNPIALCVTGLAVVAVTAFAGALWIDVRRREPDGRRWAMVRALSDGRGQYAGFVIHLGFVCLAIGVTGSALGTRRHEVVMTEGETVEWAGRSVRLLRVIQRELPDKLVAEAELEISPGGREPYTLLPAQHFHRLQNQWTTEVAIRSSWGGDFYTILHSGEGKGRVRLTFVENPLMRWIWFGGCVMGVGAVVRLWPARRRSEPPRVRTRKPGGLRRKLPETSGREHGRGILVSQK